MACIQQINLDALWGRESATVGATKRGVDQLISLWRQLGITPTLPSVGPLPMDDAMGYGVAVAMILKSCDKGRYADYQQFKIVRKLRATYTNVFMASASGVAALHTMGGVYAKHQLTLSPTHSLWFECFTKGCLSQMGQLVKQDMAISVGVMLALSALLDKEWESTCTPQAKAWIAVPGAFRLLPSAALFKEPRCS
jgi:hypothetical protein